MTAKRVEVAPKAPSLTPIGGYGPDLGGKDAKLPRDPYLFIEAGGFGGTKPTDWKTPYYVLRKVK